MKDDEWDGDEAPPTEEELTEAHALGVSVDRLLAGEPTGRADSLMQASLMIQATHREQQLAEEQRDALIQQAMREALSHRAPAARRGRRLATGSLLALAASLALVLGAAVLVWRGTPARRHVDRPSPARQTLSRSSDELMGRPFTDRAGASRRLDLVFADRLSGYRQVVLARRK